MYVFIYLRDVMYSYRHYIFRQDVVEYFAQLRDCHRSDMWVEAESEAKIIFRISGGRNMGFVPKNSQARGQFFCSKLLDRSSSQN